MSAGTVPSSSSSAAHKSQSGTQEMDSTIYIYEIPESERINLCYYIDQSGAWEEVAKRMGYDTASIIVSLHYFNSFIETLFLYKINIKCGQSTFDKCQTSYSDN